MKKTLSGSNEIETISIRTLLDASLDAAFLFDKDSQLVALNKEGLKRLRNRKPENSRKPAEFFIGKKFREFYPDVFIDTCSRYIKSVLKSKSPLQFQYQLEEKILEITIYPVLNKDRENYNFAVYSRDITELFKTASRAKQSEEKYLELINVLYEGYIMTDREGDVFFINEAVEKIGGYNKSDLIGKNIMQLFPKNELVKIQYHFDKLKNLEKTRFQTTYNTKKNEVRTLLFSASPIIDEDGKFDGIQSTITDITALKIMKENLEYRIEFEKRIIDISTSFLNLQESEIDKGIMNALDIIGRFNNEKRLLLYILNEKNGTYYKSYEWNIRDKNESFSYSSKLDTSLYPRFNEILEKEQVILVPDINALPPDVKNELSSTIPDNLGIKSFLIVPMILKNKIVGFLGSGSLVLKSWSEDEISMIKMALSVIAIVTERKKINRELTEVIFQRLSDREREFITFLSEGYKWPKDKREICKKMDVLPGTLDKFMQRIKEKVRANELEAIIKSLQDNKTEFTKSPESAKNFSIKKQG